MEKVRKQLYESLKLYFDISYDYVKEHYEIKLGEQPIENFDEK